MVLFDDVGDGGGVGVVVVVKIMITMMIMRIGEDHEAGVLTRDQFGDSEIRNCVTEHFKVQIWLFSQQVDPQRISIRPPPPPPPPPPVIFLTRRIVFLLTMFYPWWGRKKKQWTHSFGLNLGKKW